MKPLVIDTREPYEYEASHYPGAINISTQEFMSGAIPKALQDIPKECPIFVYCRSGARSNTVGHILRSQGFTNITNGINEHHVARMINQ